MIVEDMLEQDRMDVIVGVVAAVVVDEVEIVVEKDFDYHLHEVIIFV